VNGLGGKVKLCQHVLTDGPRAGQVCGRRYQAGTRPDGTERDACQNHRPPPPSRPVHPSAPRGPRLGAP
jgi:hypothetical protein